MLVFHLLHPKNLLICARLALAGFRQSRSANNAISTGVLTEVNEKNMTAIYLDVLEKGSDLLTAAQKSSIVTLAAECPYNSGRAVFTARTLQALYQPGITYSDKGICGAAYKNGGVDAEDEKAREEMEAELDKLRLLENKVILYPNPANTQLNIKYVLQSQDHGELQVIDMLGKLQMRIELDASNTQTSVNIQHLPIGIYTYRYLINGVRKETGKLTIN